MSVYSSTEQINLLKNIFTPEFQFGAGGFFQPTVKTYLPGNVEIGDPTTDYTLKLNGNALATDLTVANWSLNPAVSTLSMASSSIADLSSIQLVGGNNLTRTFGTINNLSGLQTINGFTVSLGSSPIIGLDNIRLGSDLATPTPRSFLSNVTDQVCIGYNSGLYNTSSSLVAIGQGAALGANTGGFSVCIGFRAGQTGGLNYGAVQIGCSAGFSQQGLNVVMVGRSAGNYSSGSNVTALGNQAAMNNNSSDVIAIGTNAAQNNLGSHVVATGFQAAYNNSGSAVVALGFNAGYGNTASNCVFLGSNLATGVVGNTVPNTFLIYSTQGANLPFLRGDMSANTLGIGKAPVAGFGLAVQGAIQNTLTISSVPSSILTVLLTSANAATRFFVTGVAGTINLSFPTTAPPTGTHWVVTNTTGSGISSIIVNATVFGSAGPVTLPATSGGLGRGITFAYSGIGSNYFAF
jgi:hypothetical protein